MTIQKEHRVVITGIFQRVYRDQTIRFKGLLSLYSIFSWVCFNSAYYTSNHLFVDSRHVTGSSNVRGTNMTYINFTCHSYYRKPLLQRKLGALG